MEEKVLNNEKVLEVKNLRVSFKTNTGTVKAVRGISFNLYKGKTLAIVGESGSGKSVTSKAILGILANNKIVENGQIIFDGKDLLRIDEDTFTHIRGVKISMIFQDPLSSLNPIMKVGKQLTEAMYLKSKASKRDAKHTLKFIDSGLLKYSSKEEFEAYKKELKESTESITLESFQKYHDLFIKCLTKAVEAHKESMKEAKNILEEFKAKHFVDMETFDPKETKKDLINVTHALKKAKFAFDYAPDDVIEVFSISFSEYLRSYVKSISMIKEREELLKKYNAKDIYDIPSSIRAQEREVIVLPKEFYDDLVLLIDNLNNYLNNKIDDANYTAENIVDLIMKQYVSNVKDSMTEMTKEEAKQKAIKLLQEVGINEPERRYNQYPFELSGGMRQRIVIAIALSSNPEVLICDEPTTALDVTIQSQILELINKLKEEKNLSIIFITHDLGVVANMADDIAVMYAGKIVEYGSVYDVFYDPRHPYTWALLGSMPDLETKEKLDAIPGTPPNMLLPPRGDAFAARNKYALEIDYEEEPKFYQISSSHAAATWLLDEDAPDVEAPRTVVERIYKSLKKNPENKPSYDLSKNSILNNMEGK